MLGLTDFVGRATVRAVSIAAVCLISLSAGSLGAKAETRTLKLYNLHTKERVSIAYKTNGRYSAEGLKQLNWFLRDWRRKQPTKMDTRLLDLIWEAYRQSGSRDYINVVCGFRAPETNNMLRSRSSGVAKESQHTQGKALDFFIPDVPLRKMREIGLRMQVGGVGYYPRSGSPFVHFDVGNARHWPKMSRRELVAVFPKGNTVHVPSDGKPLPGYEQALASYKARRGASEIEVANASTTRSSGGGRTLFAALFGGGGGADEEDDVADVQVAARDAAPAKAAPQRAAPVAKPVEAVAVAAMVPSPKPNLLAAGVPLPLRDTFDTSAPTPPAGVPAKEAAPTEMAALARVPLPRAAPARPELQTAPDTVSTLVASLDETPTATVDGAPAAGVSGQLAYAVPTPSERPRFETILRGGADTKTAADEMIETKVAALDTSAETPVATGRADDIRRIVESSSAMRADVIGATRAATPSVRPEIVSPASSRTVAAIPAAAAVMPSAKPRTMAAANPMLVAAIERKPVQPAARTKTAAAVAPSGKTGRLARDVASAAEQSVTQPSGMSTARRQQLISSRIAMMDLVGDTNERAAGSVAKKPNPDVLVRDVPTSVFTAGFASSPSSGKSDRFVGSAVTFLPVAKFK